MFERHQTSGLGATSNSVRQPCAIDPFPFVAYCEIRHLPRIGLGCLASAGAGRDHVAIKGQGKAASVKMV